MEEDLVFKNAVVINAENKTVWIYKNGNVKVYSKDFYDQLIRKITTEIGDK